MAAYLHLSPAAQSVNILGSYLLHRWCQLCYSSCLTADTVGTRQAAAWEAADIGAAPEVEAGLVGVPERGPAGTAGTGAAPGEARCRAAAADTAGAGRCLAASGKEAAALRTHRPASPTHPGYALAPAVGEAYAQRAGRHMCISWPDMACPRHHLVPPQVTHAQHVVSERQS